ncbi:hypothetical protein ACMGT0_20260 [Pseudomonas sp. RHF3.3-3]|uniref:Uncharacterized protein n=1 Tax=Pseudomonas asplenii TaxID=53407 RepID=A0A0M9GG46_9PSED|nr:hypothetical protein [Pseudomonas fuscovaginae]KPA90347.1 hypothetical protein PF66_03155 [Pseudomonas fuscovaginae]
MDAHKIKNHSDVTADPFPDVQKVLGDDLAALKSRIFHLFSIRFEIVLPHEMAKTQKIVVSVHPDNAADDHFSLSECFQYLGIRSRERVFINWGRFDDIDALRTTDLFKVFSSIWYPGVDDIEIFDESLNWMVAIAHDGTVALRFGP